MLPLRDDNWDRQRWPVVTAILVVANVLAFFYELSLQGISDARLQSFIHAWGVVPREFTTGRDLAPRIDLPFPVTLITSMFLHGGWGHLGGNMLYLWIFGDNVEDRFGRLPYVLFYLATGIVGSAAQILVSPGSSIPAIGASGAISGILGAYIVMFPAKRVHVLIFYFVTEVSAFVVIGMWALTQLVNGVGTIAVGSVEKGGVAWMAHVGGFAAGVVGALLWRVFGRKSPSARRQRTYVDPWN